MNTEDQTIELIEAFLTNQLTDDEAKEVQGRIDSDLTFKALVKSQKDIIKLAKIKGRHDLKIKLKSFENEQSSTVRKLFMQRFLAVAAILVICFGLGTWFLMERSVPPDLLFAENFEAYRAPANIRSESGEHIWAAVSNLYENKEYDQAASLLLTEDKFDKRNHLVQFYLGMCYLSNDDASDDEDAVNAFYEVLKEGNDYTQQAEWYLALTYLKLNLLDEAIMVFDGISRNPTHYKKLKAISIKKSIK